MNKELTLKEVLYDDFAYKRIVNTYRDALRRAIKDYLDD